MAIMLRDAPLRSQLILSLGNADPETGRRLAALGLRPGSIVRLLQKTAGGGRVVQAGETRVAVGADLSGKLEVETQQ
jgi:Fe2+ transport system protein FeoA